MIFLVLAIENLLFPLAGAAFVLKFALSRRRSLLKDLPAEMGERLGFVPLEVLSKLAGRETLWIHAASAGEVAAVSELIARLKSQKPARAVVVTCSTAAGRDRAKALPSVDAALLAPLDFYPAVSRFLLQIKPKLLLIAETELWPHMIELSFRRGVNIAVVNGRISKKSFARTRPFAFLARPFLRRLGRVAAQSSEHAARFKALGAPEDRVRALGNLKYDVKPAPGPVEAAANALLELGWSDCPIFVAGSTHPAEEDAVLEAYAAAKQRVPDLKLVLAPRHVERAREAAQNLARRGLAFKAWSKPASGAKPGPADVLLLDALGVLSAFYGRAVLSFVGGTLVPVGGHNILEPALAGCPVAFGPHTAHVEDVARVLEDAGGGFKVRDAGELALKLQSLAELPDQARLAAKAAKDAAASLQGAVGRTLDYLRDWL
ncbi:MAG TPA: glycosyltransferase N-terminal domain-containing protein [Elusimicrobiota bacterium]|nr:glycosyltransferase N-terminal domain-containing protein [Elusimicrobiota bacterium]